MATVISSSRELSSQEAAIVVKTLDSLGFIIKKEKSVLIPSQIMVFLGYVIDSVEMTVSLPEEKLNRLKKTNIVLVWERPHCSIRELAHVIGLLSTLFPPLGKIGFTTVILLDPSHLFTAHPLSLHLAHPCLQILPA